MQQAHPLVQAARQAAAAAAGNITARSSTGAWARGVVREVTRPQFPHLGGGLFEQYFNQHSSSGAFATFTIKGR